ncbi:hypothetical protein MTO96_005751 [Rhipicephalus appendiculatus]
MQGRARGEAMHSSETPMQERAGSPGLALPEPRPEPGGKPEKSDRIPAAIRGNGPQSASLSVQRAGATERGSGRPPGRPRAVLHDGGIAPRRPQHWVPPG